MQDEVEHGRIQDGRNGECFAGRRRSGQDEDAGADDRSDAESRQAPRARASCCSRLSGSSESAISASMFLVRKQAHYQAYWR